jgi:hypothetical protein
LSGCLRLNCLPTGSQSSSMGEEPLRDTSGRGHLAKRFGGLAWLAHRVYCCRGCTHREREGASSGGKEPCGASDGRICKEVAKSSGEHPMAGCKEGVLLLNPMKHAGTQSRGTGLHHTRAAAAERQSAERQQQSAALHKSDDVHKCWHVARDFGPGFLAPQVPQV